MNKECFVYILTNHTNSVFYTGITNNLKRRIWEHKNKANPDSFTGKYRVYKLVWFEHFNTPEEAIIIEKKVKDMRREKKLKLIQEKNPNMEELK
jgi:putative endonuclease